jgi:hypothetical protein
VKVPMQFLILLLGAMVFLFYQFEEPPIYFNRPAYDRAIALGHGAELNELQAEFDDVFARKRDLLNSSGVNSASRQEILQLDAKARELRDRAKVFLNGRRQPEKQGFRLRLYHFRPPASAAWRCWTANCGDPVRHDVGYCGDAECAGLNHGGGFLSTADPAERA